MYEKSWEIWIDVGGTFTDCLARSPSGSISKHKLLSSGVTKGRPTQHSVESYLLDPHRKVDPQHFWEGYKCSLYDSDGNRISETVVIEFDAQAGSLRLSEKVSWSKAESYELTCECEAPIVGIRYLLGLPLSAPIPSLRLRLGTTKGTNALLTRAGARTALVTTQGHGDFLHIGYQDRPELFELTIHKPEPLAEVTIEVDERMAADGEVLKPLEVLSLRQKLLRLKEMGIESLAICLLHADRHPEHEQMVAKVARELGFKHLSVSSEVAPLTKLVIRGETTVVDAYLTPVLSDYISSLRYALPGSQILMMTSAGGMVDANSFRGYQSVLSGPAGGVVGFAQAAQRAGFDRAIGFDMGGTSTDVARFDATKAGGAYEMEYESRKAGVRFLTPTLAIDTVAAGGGSICRFDGAKLVVGPESAGAEPGPACYGRGGPLCVTDLNFFLGRIAEEQFPFQLDLQAVQARLQEISDEVLKINREELSLTELAEGLLTIANANMVRAARGVSIAKGEDPQDYILVSFGGAGSQHACAVANELGIRKILYHPHSSILSAYGIGNAAITHHSATSIGKRTSEISIHELDAIFDEISVEPRAAVTSVGVDAQDIEVRCSLDMRYEGTETPLSIPFSIENDLKEVFNTQHSKEFGYLQSGRPIEIVTARTEVLGNPQKLEESSNRRPRRQVPEQELKDVICEGEKVQIPSVDLSGFEPGDFIEGPAILHDRHSTVFVEAGWTAEKLSLGEVLLTSRDKQVDGPTTNLIASRAVTTELFNNLLAGIAEQMGHILRRTASSVNVKERLDFSCAVFSAQGALVANAPHVPVHLGAMGTTIRSLLREQPNMSPGDVYVTNDPYRGGSHLPDVTVISPVHHEEASELLFFVACRAHHAEIGGVLPGSMPPNSTSLAEEGVLIRDFALVTSGESREEQLRKLLLESVYPTRHVEENLADIRAQVAANQYGIRELKNLVVRYGKLEVFQNIEAIQRAAESKVRRALGKLDMHRGEFRDYLETAEGKRVPICVRITFSDSISEPAAVFDFSGSAMEVEGNLNATPAIVNAAVLYVLRLLVDEDIPLNEGALSAVQIELPHGLLNPREGASLDQTPAVAAGNVETSQRIVDVLLGALSLAAASQGTMNNLIFGNSSFGYYETICGGSGATAAGPGADAVQVHMTNTRATDPEILERRYPVRLLEFSIRQASGGSGSHRGGNGVVRRLEFLEKLELSLITGRRSQTGPFGIAGGGSGLIGRNQLSRSSEAVEPLDAICSTTVFPGDILEVSTPGGGGYGRPVKTRQ